MSDKTSTNLGSIRKRIQSAIESQKQETVTVLSSLLSIQDELHYIPEEAIEEVAKFCKLSVNDVWSVACYYTNFRFSPPGKYTLDVCWGPVCHIKGAQKIIKRLHKELGVEDENLSMDGKITLRYSTCLGACSHAPVVAVDHKLEGNVDEERAAKLVKDLGEA